MKNIEAAGNAVLLMDKHLREELLIRDGAPQEKKLWENTYIKKQIEKREKGGAFTVSDHICAMVYSMLTSGASWSRVEPSIDIETGHMQHIDEIFFQYEADTLLSTDPMELVDKVKADKLGTQHIRNQMYALIENNIPKMLSFEKDHGNIDSFYLHFINADASLKTLVLVLSANDSQYKYVQIGEALAAEYLRNVGYDIAKPDRHICRILGSRMLGCSDKEIVPTYESFDIVRAIAKELGKPTAEVDYILWSYCADGYGEVCTANKPKCDKCVAEQCKNKFI